MRLIAQATRDPGRCSIFRPLQAIPWAYRPSDGAIGRRRALPSLRSYRDHRGRPAAIPCPNGNATVATAAASGSTTRVGPSSSGTTSHRGSRPWASTSSG